MQSVLIEYIVITKLKAEIHDHILKINEEGESPTAISGYLRRFQTVGRCHPPLHASQ